MIETPASRNGDTEDGASIAGNSGLEAYDIPLE